MVFKMKVHPNSIYSGTMHHAAHNHSCSNIRHSAVAAALAMAVNSCHHSVRGDSDCSTNHCYMKTGSDAY